MNCTDVLDATVEEALLIHDESGSVLYASRSARQRLGCDGDGLDGWSPTDAQGPRLSEFQQEVQSALEKGSSAFRWRTRRITGEEASSEVTLRRRTTRGRTRIIASLRDDDGQNPRERPYGWDQRFCASLVGAMIYEITIGIDGSRTITYLSDSVRELYGVSPEEGKADSSLLHRNMHPDDLDGFQQAEETAIREGSVFRVEARVIEPSGSVRWSSFVANPRRLDDGSIVLNGIEIIVTDRKRAEEALADCQRNLKETQELAKLGSWTLDLPTNRLHWSQEVFRIFEIDPRAFAASFEAFLAAIHPEDRELVQQAYLDSLRTKTPYSIEHRLQMPDGRIKYVHEVGVTYWDADGRPLRSVGTVLDISKEKEAAKERANLEEQLHHAQRMESIGQLAGGIAHDFNNMLGVILGNVELALPELSADHSVRGSLHEIDKAAQRAKELTRQLLAFARKQTIAPRVLDMNEAVASMLKMLKRLIGEHIELTWLPASDVWAVKVDPSQVDQILVNLCVNSRDAIEDVGKVTIETKNATFGPEYCASHLGFCPGDYVRLTVSDNGCGMDRETVEHIFEPFFTTKPLGSGTGLGLAMVYGAVKQNGGFINVYSEPGKGTTFAIYLARYLGDEETAPLQDLVNPPLLGTETVLLVEDEPSLLAIIALILRKHGYTVLSACASNDALGLAEAHRDQIKLLITDVVMPDMNGRQLAERVTQIVPGIKRLFMSGYTANVIAHHNILDRGVHFIQKPFSEKEFASKVREALQAASERPA